MAVKTFLALSFFVAALSCCVGNVIWGAKIGELQSGVLLGEVPQTSPKLVRCVIYLADRSTNKVPRKLYAPAKEELLKVELFDSQGNPVKGLVKYGKPLRRYSRNQTRRLRVITPPPGDEVSVEFFDPRDIFAVNHIGNYTLSVELRILQDFGGDELEPLVFPTIKTNIFLLPKVK